MSILQTNNIEDLLREQSQELSPDQERCKDSRRKLTKKELILKKISDIDDFIGLCDERGCFRGMEPKESEYEIEIDSPYTKRDAKDIRNLFETTYRGTYPYLEMLDLNYLMKSFFEEKFEWIVFRLNDASLTGQGKGTIIGSWLWVIDYDQRRAYNRGFNLLPKYHGKLPMLNLTYQSYRPLMLKLKGKIDKWYNESRTAHTKSQFLSHGGGAHTDVLFMNKDYFMGKKESDVMMVAFFKDGMKNRKQPTTLLPEVAPFYVLASKNHGLDIDGRVELKSNRPKIDPLQVSRVLKQSQLTMNCDKYGYVHFSLSDPETKSRIKGLHTSTVKNIENISVECENLSVFMGLWYKLKQYCVSHDIEYMECILPVSDIKKQKALLNLGMEVQGYIPSWIGVKYSTENEENELFEDAVVFGWTKKKVKKNTLKLTHEGKKLVILMQNSLNKEKSNQSVVLRDKKPFGTMFPRPNLIFPS